MLLRSHSVLTIVGVTIALLAPPGLDAQEGAWIRGTVADDEGSAIAGVKVTVTSGALADFQDRTTSNKKGKFRIMVPNAGPVYELRFSKEGYATLVVKVKPVPGGTSTVEAVMAGAGTPRPQPAAGSQTAEDAYNAGIDALESGDLDTAVARLREVIAIDPGVAVVHAFLARAYLELGEYAEAAASADTALELEPADSTALYVRYTACRGLGDEDRAADALAAIVGSGGAEEAAKRIFNEAAEAYGSGDMATANAMFDIVIEIDPNIPEAYSALAEIHRLDGKYEQSLAMADRALDLRPGDPHALRSRFNALFSLQRTEELHAAVDELAVADPEWASSRLPQLALAAFNQNLMDVAVVLLEKTVEIDPSNAKAHYNLGVCLFNLGDRAHAGEALKRFLELAPGDRDAEAARSMLEYVE